MKTSRFHVELRAEIAGDTLTGHAAVFDQLARTPQGWEAFGRAAFDAVLRSADTDAVSLWNHDPSMPLGRQSAGTLRVGTDAAGLEFELDIPPTTYGNDMRISVERGDVTGGSLGFVPGQERNTRGPQGMTVRTHTSVAGLRDVSPVTFPAYEGAGVRLRSISEFEVSNRHTLVMVRARVGGLLNERQA